MLRLCMGDDEGQFVDNFTIDVRSTAYLGIHAPAAKKLHSNIPPRPFVLANLADNLRFPLKHFCNLRQAHDQAKLTPQFGRFPPNISAFPPNWDSISIV